MIPIKEIVKIGSEFCKKNAPTILTAVGCVGVAATGYLSYQAGIKTIMALDDLAVKKEGDDISPKEKALVMVKEIAPTAAVGAVTMAAIISSNIISIRRAKALAASYAILAESAEVYRRKVIEKIGERKEDEIEGEIAKEEFEKDSGKEIQAVQTHGGTYLCKDGITGQYFRASAEWILKTLDTLNSYYIGGEDTVSVNEYCSAFGLEPVCDEAGELVWPSAMRIKPDLRSVICPNGEPGYFLFYSTNHQPMCMELAESYNQNHYIYSDYDY